MTFRSTVEIDPFFCERCGCYIHQIVELVDTFCCRTTVTQRCPYCDQLLQVQVLNQRECMRLD